VDESATGSLNFVPGQSVRQKSLSGPSERNFPQIAGKAAGRALSRPDASPMFSLAASTERE